MGLKARLRQLEKTAREKLDWLDLPDGSSFYFDRERTGMDLFRYSAQTMRALRSGEPPPEPPEVLRVIARLRPPEDRRRAFRAVHGSATKPFITFDPERFFATGEIEHDPRMKRGQDEGPPDDDNVVRLGKPPEN